MQYNVYNKSGEIIGSINKAQEQGIDKDKYLKAVTCFVLNENGEVLIEKRANKGMNPGELDLCSGHIEKGETPTQTMIRELQEELGIDFEESIKVRKVSKEDILFEIEDRGKKQSFFVTIYCLKRNSSKVKIQEEEIDEIHWVSLEKCFEIIKENKTRLSANYDYREIFEEVRNIRDGIKTSNKER